MILVRSAWSAWAWAALLVTAACGGKVVFDGAPGSSAGGAGGAISQSNSSATTTSSPTSTSTSTTSASPATTGSGACGFPSQDQLSACSGGSAGSGFGGNAEMSCFAVFCDANGDSFEVDCANDNCTCIVNGVTTCTCSGNTQEACFGMPSCCGGGS